MIFLWRHQTTLIGIDVLTRDRVCGGDDDFMETWKPEMRKTPSTIERSLGHERDFLGGPTTLSFFLSNLPKCQDVTLEGVDVTLRVSLCALFRVKFKLICKGEK
jgi:hypothetical protein